MSFLYKLLQKRIIYHSIGSLHETNIFDIMEKLRVNSRVFQMCYNPLEEVKPMVYNSFFISALF